MIQNTLKILTLGFFISMISGFVLYRSGYFTANETRSSLHVSPNGGELLNSAVVDTNHVKVEEFTFEPIMPSSKSIAPAFDLKKYEREKAKQIMPSSKSGVQLLDGDLFLNEVKLENPYMSSSKSFLYPVKFEYNLDVSSLQNRQAIQKQPELIEKKTKREDTIKAYKQKIDREKLPKGETIEKATTRSKKGKHKGIAWSTIGMGLLGIVFVSIGSIVYFKRRSK